MTRNDPCARRRRLPTEDVHPLRHILDRDEHTWQFCGSHRSLQVHHVRRRSRGGNDSPANLLTLCHRCHGAVHSGEIRQTTRIPYRALYWTSSGPPVGKKASARCSIGPADGPITGADRGIVGGGFAEVQSVKYVTWRMRYGERLRATQSRGWRAKR